MSDPRDEPELPPELDPRGRRPSAGAPRRPAPRRVEPTGRRPAPRVPPPVPRSTRPVPPLARPPRPTTPGPAPFQSDDHQPAQREVVPPRPPHSRRATARRLLAGTAGALSLVMLAVTGLGYFYVQALDGNIDRIGPISLRPDSVRPKQAPSDARNVLLIGSDSRDNDAGIDRGSGATATSGQRADTIILAHLYGDSDAAQLVSFPRDSWVRIPAFKDKAGRMRPSRMSKINSAITDGGIPLLVATLEDLTRVRIDNFLVIDFAGFQAMVNTLGGVEVCLLQSAKEKDSGIDLRAGRQTISGAQALAFVRQRQELPRGDIDRIARQQHFIGSLVRKVLAKGTLLNPGKLNGFLSTLTKNVSTDNSLDFDELVTLGLRLRSFSTGGVAFTTVPFTDINGRRNGQSVVLLDDAKVETLFAAIRADRAPGQLAPKPKAAPVPTAGLFVPPSSIRVNVFNGGGTQGAGRKAADDLSARGFRIVNTPENRGSGASTTVVRYGPDKADSARTLAASIPGATLELDRSLTRTLEVVVGLDYTGTRAVTLGEPPAASPSPAPDAGGNEPLATAATAGCVN